MPANSVKIDHKSVFNAYFLHGWVSLTLKSEKMDAVLHRGRGIQVPIVTRLTVSVEVDQRWMVSQVKAELIQIIGALGQASSKWRNNTDCLDKNIM